MSQILSSIISHSHLQVRWISAVDRSVLWLVVIQTFSYNHWLARFRLGPLHSSASPLHLSGLVWDALLLWWPHLGVMPALSPAALRVNDASLLSLGRLVFSPEPSPAFLYPEGQAHRWCHEYCMMK